MLSRSLLPCSLCPAVGFYVVLSRILWYPLSTPNQDVNLTKRRMLSAYKILRIHFFLLCLVLSGVLVLGTVTAGMMACGLNAGACANSGKWLEGRPFYVLEAQMISVNTPLLSCLCCWMKGGESERSSFDTEALGLMVCCDTECLVWLFIMLQSQSHSYNEILCNLIKLFPLGLGKDQPLTVLKSLMT